MLIAAAALVFSAIGCHAQHLACNVSGLAVEAVSADVGVDAGSWRH